MPTRMLRLKKQADGYYRTQWIDDNKNKRRRSFGKNRREAEVAFGKFHNAWRTDPTIRNGPPDEEKPRETLREGNAKAQKWADARYVKNGKPTREASNIADAMRPLLELCGDMPLRDVNASHVLAVRNQMVVAGLSVSTINARVSKIRNRWQWFYEHQMASAETWAAMKVVRRITVGEPVMIDGEIYMPTKHEKIQPVPEAEFWATVEAAVPTLQAMILFAYYTGARPGEVCAMRPTDLNRKDEVWVYMPASHKNEHHGRSRVIFIGPQARKQIESRLTLDVNTPIFKPADVFYERKAAEVAAYKPAPGKPDYRNAPSYQKRAAEKSTARFALAFTRTTFGQVIRRACKVAGVPAWSPNQLRHSAGTRIREKLGLEITRAVLGHADSDTTEIYAERDEKMARNAAAKMG